MKKILLLAFACVPQMLLGDMITEPGSIRITRMKMRAARFLSQATMGATAAEVNALAQSMSNRGYLPACEAWIDNQFSRSITNHIDVTNANRDSYYTRGRNYQDFTWWHQMRFSNDQLRQRVTWGLSQIVVASANAQISTGNMAGTHYWDILQRNAFGNYSKLLNDVTYSPLMGRWLSSLKNAKGVPEQGIFADENYAREVMQLFSTGIYKRHGNGNIIISNGEAIPNFTEDDVLNLAKIMTGLNYGNANGNIPNGFFTSGSNWEYPMIMDARFHDLTEKTFKGVTFPASTQNQNVGRAEIDKAIEMLATDRQTSIYISTELIKRMTTSNPSAAYILDVGRVWRASRGNMRSVIKAILLNRDLRHAVVYPTEQMDDGRILVTAKVRDDLTGKIKEPVLQATQFLRTLEVEANDRNYFTPTLKVFNRGGQRPLYAGSVFNDFSREFLPPAGPLANVANDEEFELVAPELQLVTSTYVEVLEEYEDFVRRGAVDQDGNRDQPRAPLTVLNEWENNPNLEEVLQEMNLYLCGGHMPYELQKEYIEILENNENNSGRRVEALLSTIYGSADYIVAF